ncbi:hypothetical protein ACFO60_12785 [Sphaerisporangium dianthi]|uniref:Uncharacterized protein n=1 Tax=Sphaerisporangium dianthi TaxID=1436120 RepID=A0ABV9CG27_9ACTN
MSVTAGSSRAAEGPGVAEALVTGDAGTAPRLIRAGGAVQASNAQASEDSARAARMVLVTLASR